MDEHPVAASGFNADRSVYESARPSYPPAALVEYINPPAEESFLSLAQSFAMALYDGEHASSVYSSFSSNTSNLVVNEDRLLSSYQDVTSESFKGVREFRSFCFNRERDFVHGSVIKNQYIAFTAVRADDMMMIDKAREVRGRMPRMCVLYDAGEEVLIVKIMVGLNHELASESFSNVLHKKLVQLNVDGELDFLGSARFRNTTTKRQKEPDKAMRPRTRGILDWPSITFEVGFSESLSQLQLDARFWLTQSDLKTKIVILIHLGKDEVTDEKWIHLERWEVLPDPPRPHRQGVSYSPTCGCMQTIVLLSGAPYTGPSLGLPLSKLFDTVPTALADGACDITAPELNAWKNYYLARSA